MRTHALRRGMTAGAIVLLALVSGCRSGEPVPRQGEWGQRRTDVSCRNDKKEITDDRYDLNDDGKPEAFLIMRCQDKKDPEWHLLEVLPSSDPAADPVQFVLQTDQGSIDQLCFIRGTAIYRFTVGDKSAVRQIRWPLNAPKPVEAPRPDLEGCPSPIPPAGR